MFDEQKGVARSLEFAENLLECSQSVLANNNWAHHTIFRPHNVHKTQLALVARHPIYALNMCAVHTVGQHLHNKFGMSHPVKNYLYNSFTAEKATLPKFDNPL